ncbi:MAG TPA: glycosyltransferase [Acidobacteriota bacterium]|nr:glycosyltransferase [Acidobacteriota bacterium]
MKVLLIHATIGWGHKRAALALAEAFQERGIETEVHDLLDFIPWPISRLYPSAYSFMVSRSRPLWRLFYKINDLPKSPYAPANAWTQRWQFTKFFSFLQENKFNFIVSTHFTPSALLLDWRKKLNSNFGVYSVVTDFVSHRCWKRDGLDHYFVATQEVKNELVECGFAADKITIAGIPISRSFSQPLLREESRNEWNIKDHEKLVLVLSSGLSPSKTRTMIQDLKEFPGNIRYLVSAGKEAPREQQIQRFCGSDKRFTVFGFSPRIAEMMRAADVLISKPGGLTVSEALSLGLPQILFSPIPGQEEANAQYVVRHGAGACIEAKKGHFKSALAKFLNDAESLKAAKKSANNLGKPHAASTIVDFILKQ